MKYLQVAIIFIVTFSVIPANASVEELLSQAKSYYNLTEENTKLSISERTQTDIVQNQRVNRSQLQEEDHSTKKSILLSKFNNYQIQQVYYSEEQYHTVEEEQPEDIWYSWNFENFEEQQSSTQEGAPTYAVWNVQDEQNFNTTFQNIGEEQQAEQGDWNTWDSEDFEEQYEWNSEDFEEQYPTTQEQMAGQTIWNAQGDQKQNTTIQYTPEIIFQNSYQFEEQQYQNTYTEEAEETEETEWNSEVFEEQYPIIQQQQPGQNTWNAENDEKQNTITNTTETMQQQHQITPWLRNKSQQQYETTYEEAYGGEIDQNVWNSYDFEESYTEETEWNFWNSYDFEEEYQNTYTEETEWNSQVFEEQYPIIQQQQQGQNTWNSENDATQNTTTNSTEATPQQHQITPWFRNKSQQQYETTFEETQGGETDYNVWNSEDFEEEYTTTQEQYIIQNEEDWKTYYPTYELEESEEMNQNNWDLFEEQYGTISEEYQDEFSEENYWDTWSQGNVEEYSAISPQSSTSNNKNTTIGQVNKTMQSVQKQKIYLKLRQQLNLSRNQNHQNQTQTITFYNQSSNRYDSIILFNETFEVAHHNPNEYYYYKNNTLITLIQDHDYFGNVIYRSFELNYTLILNGNYSNQINQNDQIYGTVVLGSKKNELKHKATTHTEQSQTQQFNSLRGSKRATGSWKQLEIEELLNSNSQVAEQAISAVQEKFNPQSEGFEFKQILSVHEQIVSGVNYQIKLLYNNAEEDSRIYQVIIYSVPWSNKPDQIVSCQRLAEYDD